MVMVVMVQGGPQQHNTCSASWEIISNTINEMSSLSLSLTNSLYEYNHISSLYLQFQTFAIDFHRLSNVFR